MADLPKWMEPLVEKVASSITVHGPDGPLELRFRKKEGRYEILLYLLPVEMVGGPHDGGLAAPGFLLDLPQLQSAFTRVDALYWDAHGTGEEQAADGPCLAVQGEFDSRTIWLRVLAYAPDDVGPAAKVDGTGRRQAG